MRQQAAEMEAGQGQPPMPPTSPPTPPVAGGATVGHSADGDQRGGPQGRFPCKSVVDRSGIEPLTSSVQGRLYSLPIEGKQKPASHCWSRELQSFAAKSRASLPNASQRSKSRTEHLGCRMIADQRPTTSQGEDPKVVQERLGHANVSTTLNIYSHVAPNMQEEAAEKIDQALRGVLVG